MPRLTRTQKFAEYREQLANDKEQSINTHDLSSYQDRLNNVQKTLSPEMNSIPDNSQVVNSGSWSPFGSEVVANETSQEKPREEVNNVSFDEFSGFVDPTLAKKQNSNIEETVFVIPSSNDANESIANDNKSSEEHSSSSYFDSFMDTKPIAESLNDFDSYFEPIENEPSVEEVMSNVFDDVKDNTDKIVSQNERDTYLDRTLSDVHQHNVDSGLQTIDSIINSSVDEIRHPENNVENNVEQKEIAEFKEEVIQTETIKEEPIVEQMEEPEDVLPEFVEEDNIPDTSFDIDDNSSKVILEKIESIYEELNPNKTSSEDTISENVPNSEENLNEQSVEETAIEEPISIEFVQEEVSENNDVQQSENVEKTEIIEEVPVVEGPEAVVEEVVEPVSSEQSVEEPILNELVQDAPVVEGPEAVVEEVAEPVSNEQIQEEVVSEPIVEEANNNDDSENDIEEDFDNLFAEASSEINGIEINEPATKDENEQEKVEEKTVVLDNTYSIPAVEETNEEKYDDIEIPEFSNDNDFSSTVTLEITKIMDEISNIPAVEEQIEEPVNVTTETVKFEENDNEEEVVEIKNISEIDLSETTKDTLSSTIPFVVAAEDEEILEYDEDEESGDSNNTVLNVILIVLIIVLFAVLGLIIFYILKTKGII